MSLRSAPSVILSAAKELAHRDPSLRSGRPQTAVYAKRFPTWLAREEKFIASRKSFPFGCAQGFGSPADFTRDDNNQNAGLAHPAIALLAPATAF
jgi:hypothetical protein